METEKGVRQAESAAWAIRAKALFKGVFDPFFSPPERIKIALTGLNLKKVSKTLINKAKT